MLEVVVYRLSKQYKYYPAQIAITVVVFLLVSGNSTLMFHCDLRSSVGALVYKSAKHAVLYCFFVCFKIFAFESCTHLVFI